MSVAAKRNDPGYIQIAGDVKKNVGLKFKAACTLREISLGDGLEQAILLWLELKETEENQPKTKGKGTA